MPFDVGILKQSIVSVLLLPLFQFCVNSCIDIIVKVAFQSTKKQHSEKGDNQNHKPGNDIEQNVKHTVGTTCAILAPNSSQFFFQLANESIF